jgi:hypothetical protein
VRARLDDPDPDVRQSALWLAARTSLREVVAPESMPVILPRLAGGRLATAAVEALGIAAAGTGRDDVVEAVRRAGPDYRGPRRIIEALLRVGGNEPLQRTLDALTV